MAEGLHDSFEPAWGAALDYADAMTAVGARVNEDIFDAMRSHWSTAQIVEITAVISLFNYFNRFAVALDVPPTR